MPEEETHVDRAVEGIKKKIGVNVFAQFTALDTAVQSCIGLAAAWPEKALAERRDQIFVTLAGSQYCRYDPAAWAAKHLNQLPHLAAHVCLDASRVWEVEFAGGAAGESVGDQCPFVGPPSINGSFSDRSALGHVFDGEIGKTAFAENLQSASQDRQSRLLAAGTPWRALPIPIFGRACRKRPFAHGPTVPYNHVPGI